MKINPMTRFLLLIFVARVVYSQPYGLETRLPNTDFKILTDGGPLTEMKLDAVFSGLSFDFPLLLTHAGDGTDRLFVIEKGGRIYVFKDDPAMTEAKVFINLYVPVKASFSEAGLLGLAFHPDYENNGRFYVHYTFGDLQSRIVEYHVSEDPDRADYSSERILLTVDQPFRNHNGGMIAFGPDGYLYISLGDGGGAGDPYGNGQNINNMLGAILRIDVDDQDPGREYRIPEDNSFFGSSNNVKKEIWAYGLRNVWRFSFDRLTGDLWAGDVGQYLYEEIDIIVKGGNYGWNTMEGNHCYSPKTGCNRDGLILPVQEYDHDQGRSVTGGYVYRGNRLPRLYGIYLYGDYVSRSIWGLRREDNSILGATLLAQCPSSITSFGESESGEVYVVGQDGKIYIFQENEEIPAPGHIPQTLSESGLYKDILTLSITEGIIPYNVISPLWSDGASKTRYFALPDTSKVTFSSDSSWSYPRNSVMVKNFFLEKIEGDTASREIVETRFLVKHFNDEGWDGFSYQWRDDLSDADLLDSSAVKIFQIQKKDGTFREQAWYYPSRSDCQVCHPPSAGWILGARTDQINRKYNYGEKEDNQLRTLNHIHFFTEDIGEDYRDFYTLTNPADTSASLQKRVRSYLDANCANCHRMGGTGRAAMDLRSGIELDETNILDVPVELDDMNISGAMRIQSGEPDSSILLLRMLNTDEFRMPQLGSSIVDTFATTLINEWILSMADSLLPPDTTGIDTTDTDTTETGSVNVMIKPDQFSLYAPFPNPFNASTSFIFSLPVAAEIHLKVLDIRGRHVDTMIQVIQNPGCHRIKWPGHDHTTFHSGIYIAVFNATPLGNGPSFHTTRKLILLK